MGNTTIQTQSFRAVDAGQTQRYIIPFALLCSLFFLWAVANNLNDILLPQFQQAFTLTNFQAGLIQSAFYFGYFVIPIPAGILMKKLSYKAGIITGLFLYALGRCIILAGSGSNELHIILNWPIYYCCWPRLPRNRSQPICDGIRP
ncbi:L-fucose permease [Kluyvera cryocrescens]|uniref:L-fucose permease n=1 Tax=Kluyvera cryocrescens TaxID=580 RepID=A0A485ANZ5_KLUCR|nr:L-fucose permease [Kluyvera cryocrescens]